jgi:hypothetical protein
MQRSNQKNEEGTKYNKNIREHEMLKAVLR